MGLGLDGKVGGDPRQKGQQEHRWCIPGAVHAGVVKGDREAVWGAIDVTGKVV